MRWIRTSDELPQHEQEVLLRHQGILFLAVYNRERSEFRTKVGVIVEYGNQDIWCGFIGSELTSSNNSY